MKIIIDAMGGDNAPLEIVKGSLDAQKEYGVDIVLVGKIEEILKVIDGIGLKTLPKGVEIANADSAIEAADDPSTAVRAKRDSSMSIALSMLVNGGGDGMVSAGSTGALLSGATLIVKRVKGIRRAALAPILPSATGDFMLIDCGANVECTPEYLLQFAYMGSFYAKNVQKKENPKIALLNIGVEREKGMELQREAYKLLETAGSCGDLNFIGNLEGREAMLGGCDVLVADGFSGNVFLKTAEGVGSFMNDSLKGIFFKNTVSKLAAALVKDDLTSFKKKIDYKEYGGTALLGISMPVVKAHGSAKAYDFKKAISQTIGFASSGIIDDIRENIEHMN